MQMYLLHMSATQLQILLLFLMQKKRIPSQKFISIGVAPPHLHLESRMQARISYELKLKEAGADLVLNTVNDLKNIDIDFFKKF